MIALPAPAVRLVADCPSCALHGAPGSGHGCLEHTCPDCGTVSDFVCGTEPAYVPIGTGTPVVECPVLNQVFASTQCHDDAHGAIFGRRTCSALGSDD